MCCVQLLCSALCVKHYSCFDDVDVLLILILFKIYKKNIQSVPKKMSFLGKIATTTFKLIQNAKAGGVLENSGYLLQNGH